MISTMISVLWSNGATDWGFKLSGIKPKFIIFSCKKRIEDIVMVVNGTSLKPCISFRSAPIIKFIFGPLGPLNSRYSACICHMDAPCDRIFPSCWSPTEIAIVVNSCLQQLGCKPLTPLLEGADHGGRVPRGRNPPKG